MAADNVALPTFAAVCRAMAWPLLTTSCAAIVGYLLAAGPITNPHQRTDGTDRRTDTQQTACYAGNARNAEFSGFLNMSLLVFYTEHNVTYSGRIQYTSLLLDCTFTRLSCQAIFNSEFFRYLYHVAVHLLQHNPSRQ